MEKVVILGSSSAVPDTQHENTHILVEAGSRIILVDCPGSPTVRLEQAGYNPRQLTDIILTHFHPDHVSGFAPLIMSMWLIGRKDPLNVYGLPVVIDRAQKMLELYEWQTWPNFYPVHFHAVEAGERATVIASEDIRVFGSLVDHMIPTLGLRFEFGQSKRMMAYSCDTEPSQVVRRLAQDVDVLIHESTGSSVGHTPPEKAGEIATQAGAKSLYLIHYPPQLVTHEALLERGKQTFGGPLFVAKDFMEIPMG